MDIQQLAVEYDKFNACVLGYADGDYQAIGRWLNWFDVEGDKPKALAPDREPDAVSTLGGREFSILWYKLEDGRIVGVDGDFEKREPGNRGGYIFPADVGEIQTVEDYQVPVIPWR